MRGVETLHTPYAVRAALFTAYVLAFCIYCPAEIRTPYLISVVARQWPVTTKAAPFPIASSGSDADVRSLSCQTWNVASLACP